MQFLDLLIFHIYHRAQHVTFKYIHKILAQNKKMYNIGNDLSPNCDTFDVEESNIHMFLYCYNVQGCLDTLCKIMCKLQFHTSHT